jgi:hypothetical protein
MSHEGKLRNHSAYINVSLFVVCLFVCLFVCATDSIITTGKGKLVPVLSLSPCLESIWGRWRYTSTHSLLWFCVQKYSYPCPAALLPGKEPPDTHWIDGGLGPKSCFVCVGEGQYLVPLQNVQIGTGTSQAFCLVGIMVFSGYKAAGASSWSLRSTAEVKNELCCTSTPPPPICIHGVDRDNYTIFFTLQEIKESSSLWPRH